MCEKYKYPLFIMFHPIDGFEEMVYKKMYSVVASFVVLALWFFAEIFRFQMTGFSFITGVKQEFNIFIVFLQTIFLFCLWVVANWSYCTISDGMGKMWQIWVVSSYALLPYSICIIIGTILSRVMITDEATFYKSVILIGFVWSVVLMISGLMAVHDYFFLKTIFSIFITIVGIAIMLFIIVLTVSLFLQIYNLFSSMYNEIIYRM